MTDMRDALNELAQRGEPRGFDDVVASAADAAAREAAQRDSEDDDLETIPLVASEPIVASVLGVGLMHERFQAHGPISKATLAVCVVAMLWSVILLAQATSQIGATPAGGTLDHIPDPAD